MLGTTESLSLLAQNNSRFTADENVTPGGKVSRTPFCALFAPVGSMPFKGGEEQKAAR